MTHEAAYIAVVVAALLLVPLSFREDGEVGMRGYAAGFFRIYLFGLPVLFALASGVTLLGPIMIIDLFFEGNYIQASAFILLYMYAGGMMFAIDKLS